MPVRLARRARAPRSRAGSRRCAARSRRPSLVEPARAVLVELQLGRVDDRRRRAASSPSSRSSGFVNAACAGPRRPSTTTSLTARARERLDRVVGGVGRRELVGVEHEHARDVDRDVAVADRPRRARAERSNSWSAASGWPLYQATNSVAGVRAGPVLARDPEPVVVGGADRVDDRVVALEQLRRA